MHKMVKKFIQACDICQKSKQIRHTKEPFKITDTPGQSFNTVAIDTVGPLRPSQNYRYILTMQCELTKYVIACPIETKEAKSIAKALVENVILKYGIFNTLKSDRGTEFVNELMKEICQMLKIEQKLSTPYHHETMGAIERNHRQLNSYLLSFVEKDDWSSWIPYYTFAYNVTPHIDTNYTPFELVFGRLATLPGEEVMSNQKKVYDFENYANELRKRLQYSLENAKKIIEKVKQKRQLESLKSMNSIDINIGDLVLLKSCNRKKKDPPYLGPYKVININDLNVDIQIENKIKTFHKNLLKKYYTRT